MFRSIVSSLFLLSLSACSFGLRSGSLDRSIKTAAVLTFENLTSDPTLGQEVNRAVRTAIEGRLNLRPAAESRADAIVKGRIVNFNPDKPALAVRSGSTGGSGQPQVQVTRRHLEVVVEIEITNRATQQKLLANRTITVMGEYAVGREADGRKDALEKLVTTIVNEARSQW